MLELYNPGTSIISKLLLYFNTDITQTNKKARTVSTRRRRGVKFAALSINFTNNGLIKQAADSSLEESIWNNKRFFSGVSEVVGWQLERQAR